MEEQQNLPGKRPCFIVPSSGDTKVMDLEEEEEEAVKTSSQIPYDPRVNDWIREFGVAPLWDFHPRLTRDAWVNSMTMTAKGPMNASRVVGNVSLTDSFEMSLESVLEFLPA